MKHGPLQDLEMIFVGSTTPSGRVHVLLELLVLQLELGGIRSKMSFVMTELSHGLMMTAKQRPGNSVSDASHQLPCHRSNQAKHF